MSLSNETKNATQPPSQKRKGAVWRKVVKARKFHTRFILGLRVLADDHTGINLLARSYKEDTALLCVEQTVGDGLAAL